MAKTYKRKKYTNVEAFIFGTEKAPEWFNELIVKGKIKAEVVHTIEGAYTRLEFETKNGTSWGKSGDYVVKNGQGCIYPVLHDVFLELYEEV